MNTTISERTNGTETVSFDSESATNTKDLPPVSVGDTVEFIRKNYDPLFKKLVE
jgi:hypothetical protein